MTTPFVVRSDKECRWSDYIVMVFGGHAGVFSKTPKLKYAQRPALVNSAGLLRFKLQGCSRHASRAVTWPLVWGSTSEERGANRAAVTAHGVCLLHCCFGYKGSGIG